MARRLKISISLKAAALGAVALCAGALSAKLTADFQRGVQAAHAGEGNRRAAELSAADARALLHTEPLRADALRTLAVASARERADLLRLASRVSRRDPETQLLLIEDNAAAGDLAGTLAGYDALLATTPALHAQLTRNLASNLGSGDISRGLAAYADRHWFPGFLLAAAREEGADPRRVFTLARQTQHLTRGATADALGASLVEAMLARRLHADAFQAADQIAARAGNWRALGFSAPGDPARIGALAWVLTRDTSVQVEREGASGIAIAVEPSASGVAARRITNIVPGSYVVAHDVAWETARGAAAGWRVRCAADEARAPILDLPLPEAAAGTRVQFALEVPQGCAFQEWWLVVRGPEAQQSARIEVSGMTLTPTRGARMGAQL